MASLRELEYELGRLRQELSILRELQETDHKQQLQTDELTAAVDRLSIAVLGDEALGVKGLVKTVEELKNESMSTKLSKAKWAGAGVVVILLAKVLWEIAINALGQS
jgi:hypothetical protein